MLTIVVLGDEVFDETTQKFSTVNDVVLELEHSLVSLSKWESIHEKPFLTAGEKTEEEVLSYIECMILTPNFPPEVFIRFSQENLDAVNDYISAKKTATWFSELDNGPKSREVITSELVYYWLIACEIPFSCETWHLNRLLTLIKVCNLKNQPPKKMSKSEMAARNRALNAQRKNQLGTNG